MTDKKEHFNDDATPTERLAWIVEQIQWDLGLQDHLVQVVDEGLNDYVIKIVTGKDILLGYTTVSFDNEKLGDIIFGSNGGCFVRCSFDQKSASQILDDILIRYRKYYPKSGV